jgi:hypothetical protein
MQREKIIPLTKKEWKEVFAEFSLKDRKLLLEDYKWRLEVLS